MVVGGQEFGLPLSEPQAVKSTGNLDGRCERVD